MNCLFSEGKIGSMVLKHRIIMTAIHTGYPLEQETAFLAKRVKGGAAAVTAVMGVSKTGTPSNMSLLEKPFLEDLRTMAKALHREGGKLIIQLFHAGRNCSPGMLTDSKAAVMSIRRFLPPSTNKRNDQRHTTGRNGFWKCSDVMQEAGVDAVEISCSAGYLLSEFFFASDKSARGQIWRFAGEPPAFSFWKSSNQFDRQRGRRILLSFGFLPLICWAVMEFRRPYPF